MLDADLKVSFVLLTVTFHANPAHKLTRPPSNIRILDARPKDGRRLIAVGLRDLLKDSSPGGRGTGSKRKGSTSAVRRIEMASRRNHV